MMAAHSDVWVIYSPNESSLFGDNGFWSNMHGWASIDRATHFTRNEADTLELPIATGRDARFVLYSEARRHYSQRYMPGSFFVLQSRYLLLNLFVLHAPDQQSGAFF